MDGGARLFHFDNTFFQEDKTIGFLRLFQLGELQCGPDYVVEEHSQVCSEISYVVSGQGWFYQNGRETAVEKGDILINRFGETHRIKTSPRGGLRFYYIGFQIDRRRMEAELVPVASFFETGRLSVAHAGFHLAEPFHRLLNEFYSSSPYAYKVSEGLIMEILIYTYRSFCRDQAPAYRPPTQENSASTVYRIVQYIDSNAAQISHVREVAAALGYSGSYLSHLFKEKTGETLQGYLSRKKIERSVELMKSGRYSWTQIALELRYETPQAFSKAFRRVMQQSPSEFITHHMKRSESNE